MEGRLKLGADRIIIAAASATTIRQPITMTHVRLLPFGPDPSLAPEGLTAMPLGCDLPPPRPSSLRRRVQLAHHQAQGLMPIHHSPAEDLLQLSAVQPRVRRPPRRSRILRSRNRLHPRQIRLRLPYPQSLHRSRRKPKPRSLARAPRVIHPAQRASRISRRSTTGRTLRLPNHVRCQPRQILAPCRRAMLVHHYPQQLTLPRHPQNRQQKILFRRPIHTPSPKDEKRPSSRDQRLFPRQLTLPVHNKRPSRIV